MKRRVVRPLVVLAVLLTAPACLGERGADSTDDRTFLKDHELKIFNNDNRMSLYEKDAPGPVTLSVYFMLTSPFEVLELRLPPGFTHVKPPPELGCGIYSLGASADESTETDEAKAFSAKVGAKHLPPQIEHCHIWTKGNRVHVGLEVKDGVPGLSAGQTVPDSRPEAERSLWWCFALHVWNPQVNPMDKENNFTLFHGTSPDHLGAWNGDIVLRGWPIVGDWPCQYSDWEGWGQCSAMCGGGETRLRRRLVNVPPPRRGKSHATCSEELVKTVPCNQHVCKFQCELVDLQDSGACSAECGGGVKPIRSRWRGNACPEKDDYESVRYEACNPEPCKARCLLSDEWTVVTGCSEVCGQGTYRMMREVLQKDQDDPACQPEWREVKCVRQWCTQLSIIRPDRNILPYPGDTYYVGIVFKLTFPVQKITLSAPAGYSFGTPGSDCFIHDHDLVPMYKGCKVGVRSVDGAEWLDPKSITILLNGILRGSEVVRYNFMIPVTNPGCPNKNYVQVVAINGEPGPKEVCSIPYDENQWQMLLTKEMVKEGRQPIESIWANGYDLHNPEESQKVVSSGGKDLFWATTNDGAYVTMQKNSDGLFTWRQRIQYCSARLEPCPNNVICPSSGVCPSPGQFDETMEAMQEGIDGNLDTSDNTAYNENEAALLMTPSEDGENEEAAGKEEESP